MRKKCKGLLCVFLGAIMIFWLFGCANRDTSADGYLNLMDSPQTTLNNVWYNTGGIFRCAVFDSLVAVEADMKTIKPALAEKYICADDGLYYEFTLRDNVKWHDGETLDVGDVVFSLKALLRSAEVNGLLSAAFQYIEGAEAYKNGETDEISGVAVNGSTITFRLSAPAGCFLSAIAQFAILPEHILGAVAPEVLETSDYWKSPIGSGPYKITEVVENDYLILERNADYYGLKPGVEKIRLALNMKHPVAAMQAGTLDFYVTNDPEENAKLKGAPNCMSHRLNILFPTYLIFNLSEDDGVNEDLKDIRVRRALMMAIDRKAIVDVLFPGSTVSDTMVPAYDDWYLCGGEGVGFEPQEAKRLLDEAEFDFSKTIRLRYFTKGQSTEDLMSAIAVYWRAIGIKVELKMLEGSGSQHMFHTRDYDICYKRLSAFNHAAIYQEVSGKGVMQNSIYQLPVYDDLIERLNVTLEDEDRKRIVNQMQELDRKYLLRMPLFALANEAYVNEARFEMPEAYGNLWYRYDLRFQDWRLID